MARRLPHLRCKVCGSPHGKTICPVRDLNAVQELASNDLISLGLTRNWRCKSRL